MNDEILLRSLLSALQDADDRISEVIKDDPDASLYRVTRRTVRAEIRKVQRILNS